MRKLLITLLGFSLASAQAQSVQEQFLNDIGGAQQQIIAYLPALKSQPVALSIKKAANRGIRVFLIAPPKAHLAGDTYLLSVALAAAQTPPAPLSYHSAVMNAAPFVLIDNRVIYIGPGVQGIGQIAKGNNNQVAQGVGASVKTIKAAPARPIPQLMKEKYGLK